MKTSKRKVFAFLNWKNLSLLFKHTVSCFFANKTSFLRIQSLMRHVFAVIFPGSGVRWLLYTKENLTNCFKGRKPKVACNEFFSKYLHYHILRISLCFSLFPTSQIKTLDHELFNNNWVLSYPGPCFKDNSIFFLRLLLPLLLFLLSLLYYIYPQKTRCMMHMV